MLLKAKSDKMSGKMGSHFNPFSPGVLILLTFIIHSAFAIGEYFSKLVSYKMYYHENCAKETKIRIVCWNRSFQLKTEFNCNSKRTCEKDLNYFYIQLCMFN